MGGVCCYLKKCRNAIGPSEESTVTDQIIIITDNSATDNKIFETTNFNRDDKRKLTPDYLTTDLKYMSFPSNSLEEITIENLTTKPKEINYCSDPPNKTKNEDKIEIKSEFISVHSRLNTTSNKENIFPTNISFENQKWFNEHVCSEKSFIIPHPLSKQTVS